MIRHDWTRAEVEELLPTPFHDLLATAHATHRAAFDPSEMEGAILLSIKTGGRTGRRAASISASARSREALSGMGPMVGQVPRVDPVEHVVQIERCAAHRVGDTGRELLRSPDDDPLPSDRADSHLPLRLEDEF